MLEISVLMAQFPTKAIARNSHDYRTLGLGFANLGSLLMMMGVPYDSERGRNIAGVLAAILTGQAYLTSAIMAESLGPFARFEANRESMLRVMRNHHRVLCQAPEKEYEGLTVFPKGLDSAQCPRELMEGAPGLSREGLLAKGFNREHLEKIDKHLHNAFSIRSIFSKNLLGNAFLEKDLGIPKDTYMSPGFDLLEALGYTEEEIEDADRYACGAMTVEGAPHLINEHYQVFDTANMSGRYILK